MPESRRWSQEAWHKAVQLGDVVPEDEPAKTRRDLLLRAVSALSALNLTALAGGDLAQDARALAVPLVLLFHAHQLDLEDLFDQEVFAYKSRRVAQPADNAAAPTAKELRPWAI